MQKWAIVTGATSGIGEATARRLAAVGYNLILCGRREDRLKALGRALPSSQTYLSAPFDVRDRGAVEKFIKDHEGCIQQTDVLINSAGLARGTEKFQEAHIQDWEEMIDTNVKGLLYMTRLVVPFMVKLGRGHIVNLGSVAGRWVYPGGSVYCASKFAVRAISEGLRMDLLGTPLRVCNIEPGMVETEFSEVRLHGNKELAAKIYARMTPLSADDIAETILWVLQRPAHVDIQELVIFPTDQAGVGLVSRRP
jgi:3-hydroxy acid dehydrogenase / malonic semialdehyde reductase